MASFYLNNWKYYEIDFYNHSTEEEALYFINNNIELGTFYKDHNDWVKRISGMTFNIKNVKYYPILKQYLDKRFQSYLRKIKIENINGKI
jgi:hypothetical protein